MKNNLFYIILVIAFAARTISVFFFPMIYHPDELYQYFEQGYRLVEGYGVVPWEYQAGIRSWVLPSILAAFKLLLNPFTDDPEYYFYFSFFFFSLISLSAVYVFYKSVLERTDKAYSAIATLIPALFPIYFIFAPRVLTEVIAGHLLLLAIFLLNEIDYRRPWKFYFLLGALIGFAFILRFHLAFGIALPILFLLKDGHFTRIKFVTFGAALVVMMSGMIDWVTWGTPFQSIIQNIYMNIGLGIASTFSETSLNDLINAFPGGAYGLTPVFLMSVYIFVKGWRKNELFALMFLGIVIPHLMIAHKEWRFFYPSLTPLLIVLTVGLYRIVQNTNIILLQRFLRSSLLASLILTVTVASYIFLYKSGWLKRGKHQFELAAYTRSIADVEAVGIGSNFWWDTISYSLLGKNIPIIVDDRLNSTDGSKLEDLRKVPFDIKIISKGLLKETDSLADNVECFDKNKRANIWREFCVVKISPDFVSRDVKMRTLNETLTQRWEEELEARLKIQAGPTGQNQ